jgi:SAM-dependent methyltransferase
MKELTDRQFWLDYWEKKENLIIEVKNQLPFKDIFENINSEKKVDSAIEIGGFPGHFSVYLKKKYGYKVTLLDYVIHRGIISKLLLKNNIKEEELEIIEGNIFEINSNKKFDLVFSNGLIEHFDDTELIIKKHIDFLSDTGKLFITLPNFRGFNGWIQRNFDPQNYSKHNISSMDLEKLREICKKNNLKNIKVKYDGYFMMWLENIQTKPFGFTIIFKLNWLTLKVFFKIFKFNSKYFSPYINILADK